MLSALVVTGALVVKVPQILSIVRKGPGGLSSSMYSLEALAYLVVTVFHFRHGYAFSTYGENFFVLVQNVVILFLIAAAAPGGIGATAVLSAAAFGGLAAALLSEGTVPEGVLASLQLATIPVFAASRVPQIWTNFRNGSTGSLSVITVFLQFAGSSARIFTTLQEVDNPAVLTSYISGATLNGVMLLQILMYWNSDAKSAKSAKGAKKSRRAKKTD